MYQVIARKFRPKSFKEMIGQEALITTLKNQIKLDRLPHAYLFSGPRGTGKTSIARLLAKAINCENRNAEEEPCSACSSCLEIQSGSSMDVMEIDGASNRGIDDIRKINETVAFTSLSGRYKIYIIDEVHMLTKEAFNALLKTLEEPPPKVKFFFATTEVHKVLPTILSRCQRFQLNRIPLLSIVQKLKLIAVQLGFDVEEEALFLIAKRAEGGLRDAESLFDQILSFQEGKITAAATADLLGIFSKDFLFDLDLAVKEEDYLKAQKIAEKVFFEGKDLTCFYDSLLEHYRTLLLAKLKAASSLPLLEGELRRYEDNQAFYTREGLMATLDFLLEVQSKTRTQPITQTSLEQTLYKILRLSHLESVGDLVKKLHQLQAKLGEMPAAVSTPIKAPQLVKEVAKPLPVSPIPIAPTPTSPPPMPPRRPVVEAPTIEKQQEAEEVSLKEPAVLKPPAAQPLTIKESLLAQTVVVTKESISVDPTPSAADFKGVKPAMKASDYAKPQSATPKTKSEATSATKEAEVITKSTPVKHTAKTDTLLQFAAVELEGKITKK